MTSVSHYNKSDGSVDKLICYLSIGEFQNGTFKTYLWALPLYLISSSGAPTRPCLFQEDHGQEE